MDVLAGFCSFSSKGPEKVSEDLPIVSIVVPFWGYPIYPKYTIG